MDPAPGGTARPPKDFFPLGIFLTHRKEVFAENSISVRFDLMSGKFSYYKMHSEDT